jgi:hypothetical protein
MQRLKFNSISLTDESLVNKKIQFEKTYSKSDVCGLN